MRPIPPKLREELANEPRMHACARNLSDGEHCSGRITWEHCWIYAGRQINEAWAIIGLCEYHHLGAGLNKEWNQWQSINLASEEDFVKYPRESWAQKKKYLNKKYARQTSIQREKLWETRPIRLQALIVKGAEGYQSASAA